jgi:hypothetical protein
MDYDKKLAEVANAVCEEISRVEWEKENAVKSYINGMHAGADLVLDAITKTLKSEVKTDV